MIRAKPAADPEREKKQKREQKIIESSSETSMLQKVETWLLQKVEIILF